VFRLSPLRPVSARATSTRHAVTRILLGAVLVAIMFASVGATSGGPSGHWERDVASGLAKFGHASLRPWQRKVLCAWRDGRDCLVLSGTGRYSPGFHGV